ncbi:MAG: recombination protein RecR [Bdellovibrionales bacterium]|nr:recombination protein RecR [Bdellovibrionales bacterium]
MIYEGPKTLKNAVKALAKLPGIGERTAQRLVFHLIKNDADTVAPLVEALTELKKHIKLCGTCHGYTDESHCEICKDPARDQTTLCLVEDPSDLFAIERSSQFRGLYHVLHGRLSPLEGMGPKQLKTDELIARVQKAPPKEIILAMNPDVEGDATAVYFSRLLSNYNIATSRLAMGIPMGGHLEYTDQITLGRALLERRQFS